MIKLARQARVMLYTQVSDALTFHIYTVQCVTRLAND